VSQWAILIRGKRVGYVNAENEAEALDGCAWLVVAINQYAQAEVEGVTVQEVTDISTEIEIATASTTNVVEFKPVEVGEGFRFDPDELLEEAKGNITGRLAIIGEMEGGSLWVSGSANAGETMILLEMAKRKIVFGE
jgi:hypothetical protein